MGSITHPSSLYCLSHLRVVCETLILKPLFDSQQLSFSLGAYALYSAFSPGAYALYIGFTPESSAWHFILLPPFDCLQLLRYMHFSSYGNKIYTQLFIESFTKIQIGIIWTIIILVVFLMFVTLYFILTMCYLLGWRFD
jgi:hypothetical protein